MILSGFIGDICMWWRETKAQAVEENVRKKEDEEEGNEGEGEEEVEGIKGVKVQQRQQA